MTKEIQSPIKNKVRKARGSEWFVARIFCPEIKHGNSYLETFEITEEGNIRVILTFERNLKEDKE